MKKTCRLLFLILFSLSNVAHAYNHETDSLLEKLRYTIEDSTQIKLLVKLSSQSQLSADSLVMFAKRATAVAEKLKSDEWIVTAQVALCKWYIGHAQPDSAIALCSMLYERMEKKKYIKGMAQACRYIGKAYLFNAVDSAIQYNLKSMKLFKMAGDFFLYNSVKINLAVCYAQSDRLAEGIELTKQSFDYFERTGSVADLIAPSFNIGIFYRELGQLDSAIVYIRKNAYYHSLSGDPVETAISKNSIGDVLVLQKKFDEALEIFMGSIASGKKLNSTQLLDYGYMGLVRIAQNKKKWDDVVRFMQLVYDNSDKSLNERSILFENLYQAYKEKKDFSNAFKYYALFVAANDSFHGNERKQKLDEIEAKYQNKEKQSQIELLNKEKQLQIAEIEKQHLIRNTIVIALVILFGAGVLFFNSFKLKKKIESQQALLNERKRIGSELHDDLGAQLSTARMLLSNIKNSSDGNANSKLIENSLDLIDSSINDLRKIMDDLQTSTLQEKGYIAATEELVNKINKMQHIDFALTHHGIDKRLESKAEHNLFRITQELIHNTLKYAKAKNVSIDLVKRDEKIVLMFEDDGTGFDLKLVNRGYGLTNIETRIESIHGTIEFDSAPGKGFRAVLEIPIIYAGEKV